MWTGTHGKRSLILFIPVGFRSSFEFVSWWVTRKEETPERLFKLLLLPVASVPLKIERLSSLKCPCRLQPLGSWSVDVWSVGKGFLPSFKNLTCVSVAILKTSSCYFAPLVLHFSAAPVSLNGTELHEETLKFRFLLVVYPQCTCRVMQVFRLYQVLLHWQLLISKYC